MHHILPRYNRLMWLAVATSAAPDGRLKAEVEAADLSPDAVRRLTRTCRCVEGSLQTPIPVYR